MNREDIINMAREAYISPTVFNAGDFVNWDDLHRFAAIVIEAERNRLARECAMLPFGDTAASFAVWIKNGGKA